MMQTVQLATAAMGTRFELVLIGRDATHLRAVGEEAIAVIEALHQTCSVHDRSSVISRINQTATLTPEGDGSCGWVSIDGELAELLDLCAQVHEQTGGWFDVCAGRAHNDGGPGFELQGQRVRLCAPDARIDLGGIAKGWALDRAAHVLSSEGIHSALLHGGTSSVIGIGTQPNGQPWKVGLEGHPDFDQGDRTGVLFVELSDTALGVSGMDGKDTSGQVVRPGHVMNPRKGQPVRQAFGAACVTPSCALADAWSTALLASCGELGLPANTSGAVLMGRAAVSMYGGVGGGWRVVSDSAGVFDTARTMS